MNVYAAIVGAAVFAPFAFVAGYVFRGRGGHRYRLASGDTLDFTRRRIGA